MGRYMFTVRALTVLFTRRYFRNRTAIYFSVLFPLLFLGVFGGLFGGSNNTSFKVAVVNHSQTSFAKQFSGKLHDLKVLKVQPNIGTIADAKQKMNRGEIDSIVELPTDFGKPNDQGFPSGKALVYYDQSSAQAGQTVASIMQSVLAGANIQITKIQPPLAVESKSTAQKGLNSFDYIFSGLIGFSILGLGIFGPVNTLPAMKKTGALTRLQVTPLRKSQFILAYMLSTLVGGVLSIAVMFAVAVLFFHFHMMGNYLVFILFTLLGAITIFGIGVGFGGWAKDEQQAAPLSNIVSFPMMFLSGTFFPRFLMPEWLQHVSAFLPLTPIVDGVRLILTEGKTFLDLLPQLGLMAIWIVIVYTISFRVFRWE